MKAIVIKDNIIDNIIVVDSLDVFPGCIEYVENACIGDKIVEGVLIKIEQKEIVPQSITPRQARLILLQYNLLDDIELLIKDNREIQIWWEYSTDIQRNNEQLLEFANIAGLGDEHLDTMFIEASRL